MQNFLSNILGHSLPAIIVGVIAWVIIKNFFKQENLRREFELRLEAEKNLLPNRLQAYERLALFLERIKPSALTSRTTLPQEIDLYEQILMRTIKDEFEHNLAQQIYITPNTWQLIFAGKNATQNFIRECRTELNSDAKAEDLRNKIIEKSLTEEPPVKSALIALQKDIQGLSQ